MRISETPASFVLLFPSACNANICRRQPQPYRNQRNRTRHRKYPDRCMSALSHQELCNGKSAWRRSLQCPLTRDELALPGRHVDVLVSCSLVLGSDCFSSGIGSFDGANSGIGWRGHGAVSRDLVRQHSLVGERRFQVDEEQGFRDAQA